MNFTDLHILCYSVSKKHLGNTNNKEGGKI